MKNQKLNDTTQQNEDNKHWYCKNYQNNYRHRNNYQYNLYKKDNRLQNYRENPNKNKDCHFCNKKGHIRKDRILNIPFDQDVPINAMKNNQQNQSSQQNGQHKNENNFNSNNRNFFQNSQLNQSDQRGNFQNNNRFQYQNGNNRFSNNGNNQNQRNNNKPYCVVCNSNEHATRDCPVRIQLVSLVQPTLQTSQLNNQQQQNQNLIPIQGPSTS